MECLDIVALHFVAMIHLIRAKKSRAKTGKLKPNQRFLKFQISDAQANVPARLQI
jgi:hypothetical protein